MTENKPENLGDENLESKKDEEKDEDDDISEDDTKVEETELKEINGELSSDTLRRAREFLKPTNDKIKELKKEIKKLELENSGLRSDEEIADDILKKQEEIKELRMIKEEIQEEAKRQIV